MAWKIGHFETDSQQEGTIHVTRLDWVEPEVKDDNGKVTKRATRHPYQLRTAIVIPASGPGRGQAIAALNQLVKDIRKAKPETDMGDIENALNVGGGQ